jgi:hypothetical protein
LTPEAAVDGGAVLASIRMIFPNWATSIISVVSSTRFDGGDFADLGAGLHGDDALAAAISPRQFK